MMLKEIRGVTIKGLHGCLTTAVRIDAEGYKGRPSWDLFGIRFPDAIKKTCRKRQIEYLAGRYCVKKVVEKFGIPTDSSFELRSCHHGMPIWPRSFKGSVTHKDNFAVASLIQKDSVRSFGIDLEERISEKRALAIMNYVASDFEIHQYQKSQYKGMALGTYISLIFSAKESIYKAVYPLVRKQFGFKYVRIIALDLQTGSFSYSFIRSPGEGFPEGYEGTGQYHCFWPRKNSAYLLTNIVVL